MSFYRYLFFMIACTCIAWIAWGVVLWNLNPQDTGLLGFGVFYSTLLIGCIGLFSILGIGYRVFFRGRRDVVIREVKTAFRHAVILSVVTVISLALSAHDQFHWWTLIVFISVAGVIEYGSLLIQQSSRR